MSWPVLKCLLLHSILLILISLSSSCSHDNQIARSTAMSHGIADKGDIYFGVVGIQADYQASRCTGVVVSSYQLLTAGHCIHSFKSTIDEGQLLKFYYGDVKAKNQYLEVRATKYYLHDDFIKNPDNRNRFKEVIDLGVIEFKVDSSYQPEKFHPLILASSPPLKKEQIEVVGLGMVGKNDGFAPERQFGKVQLKSMKEKTLRISTNPQTQVSLLPGDSGGPWFKRSGEGRLQLVGISATVAANFGPAVHSLAVRTDLKSAGGLWLHKVLSGKVQPNWTKY